MYGSPFHIVITSFGEERTGLCGFRGLVCFAREGLCLFPLPLGVGDWLRLVIVALQGLFFTFKSYSSFNICLSKALQYPFVFFLVCISDVL